MDDPELEHLSPDFDPSSITIPRLRGILLAHGVKYPSTAKKPDLVELFNAHVAPQAKNILSSRSRTKPSSRGITNAAANGADGEEEEEDATSARSIEPTPRRTSRRTASHEPERRTPARASMTPASDAESTRTARSEARRRTRKSMGASVIKEEEPETPGVDGANDQESPFTTDNPFQSGSSPLPEPTKSDNRRRTTGSTQSRSKKEEVTSRRTIDHVPMPKRSSLPPVKPETIDPSEEESSEAGEEFTPEEQADLEEDERAYASNELINIRPRKVARRSNGAVRAAPWAILVAILAGTATVWRQEKLNVGYCGVGRPSTSIGGVDIPEWAQFLQPECEPCPQHAYCFGNLKAMCESGFVLQPHPLSLGGAVPLPPSCEPDGEKARKVKAVADRAVGELRERNAKWECGELKSSGPELGEQDLKAQVASKRRRGMSEAEFEELWAGALGEIIGRDEVTSGNDGSPPTSNRTLRSNSLATIPLSCAIRRSLRLALARHLRTLISLALLLLFAIYTRHRISSNRLLEARAKQLASFALDRLATQASLSVHEPDRVKERWISMAQLRDDVLRSEFEVGRRQRLWEKVQGKVEGNSNVRPSVRTSGVTGEVGRVWEWIGAVGAVERGGDGSAAGGRNYGDESSVRADGRRRSSNPASEGAEMVQKKDGRRWDEGRPIY